MERELRVSAASLGRSTHLVSTECLGHALLSLKDSSGKSRNHHWHEAKAKKSFGSESHWMCPPLMYADCFRARLTPSQTHPETAPPDSLPLGRSVLATEPHQR